MSKITSINQEQLSVSYFLAVAAMADTIANINKNDSDSRDATVSAKVNVNGDIVSSTVAFQLKSAYGQTYHYNEDGNIVYNLKKKNYMDLIMPSSTPIVLCLLILPKNLNDWMTQSTESLILKKCMYYISLEGRPDSDNEETVTITIDKDNLFTPESLLDILTKTVKGERI